MDDKAIETIMEAVCGICHFPYVATDQEVLDGHCAACPIEQLLKEVGGVTCDAYCQGCYYFGPAHQTCDYWEKADELRGCPPGNGCTRRITKKEYMKMAAPSKWDKAIGHEMWKDGKSDKEIGEALGVTAQAVSLHRKKYWEPGKAKAAEPEGELSQPEPVADEAPEPEACGGQETAAAEDDGREESDTKMMIRALEIFVQNLKGMKAVMTFQILQTLWDWETVDDLERAKLGLEYLIELEGGNV